jgi:hypothetical protein
MFTGGCEREYVPQIEDVHGTCELKDAQGFSGCRAVESQPSGHGTVFSHFWYVAELGCTACKIRKFVSTGRAEREAADECHPQ